MPARGEPFSLLQNREPGKRVCLGQSSHRRHYPYSNDFKAARACVLKNNYLKRGYRFYSLLHPKFALSKDSKPLKAWSFCLLIMTLSLSTNPA